MNDEHIVGLNYADRLRLATTARHRELADLFGGEMAPLTSLLGPMGEGPEWPAGAAWLAARHGQAACLISDGLSDPWVERDRPETGLSVEVLLESPDVKHAEDAPLTALADTWMFPMIAEISHTLASYPRLCEKLVGGEILSLELNIEPIKDGRGQAGVLLGRPFGLPAEISLPGGPVKLIAATLVTPSELRFLRGKGSDGRRELAEKLNQAEIGHLSLLYRASLV